jgi:hypothetical protein
MIGHARINSPLIRSRISTCLARFGLVFVAALVMVSAWRWNGLQLPGLVTSGP